MTLLPLEVSRLLRAWRGGNHEALDRLTPLVYDELHKIAHRQMRRQEPGHLFQTTALINEAFLRLVNVQDIAWQDRAHFFAVSA